MGDLTIYHLQHHTASAMPRVEAPVDLAMEMLSMQASSSFDVTKQKEKIVTEDELREQEQNDSSMEVDQDDATSTSLVDTRAKSTKWYDNHKVKDTQTAQNMVLTTRVKTSEETLRIIQAGIFADQISKNLKTKKHLDVNSVWVKALRPIDDNTNEVTEELRIWLRFPDAIGVNGILGCLDRLRIPCVAGSVILCDTDAKMQEGRQLFMQAAGNSDEVGTAPRDWFTTEARLVARDLEIKNKKEIILKLREQHNADQAFMAAAADKITKLQAENTELKASAAAAAAEADKVGAKRARTDSEAGAESAMILKLVEGIMEKDKQLNVARLKSDGLEAMLALKDNQLFMTIAEKDRQIAELNNERKDKDKKLTELNEQYIELGKEKDKQLLDKDKQLNRARAEGGAKYEETKKKWDKTIGFLRKASTTCAALLTAFASGDKNKLRSEMRKTRDLLNKIVSEHAAFAWSKALVVPELPQRRRNNDADE